MKIYTLKNERSKGFRKHGTDGYEKSPLKRASGGEDIIEISPEAMNKFRKHSVVRLEREILKRDLQRLLPVLLKYHPDLFDDPRGSVALTLENHSSSQNQGEYELTGEVRIEKTKKMIFPYLS